MAAKASKKQQEVSEERELSSYSKGKVEQILKAARQLFVEQGFATTGMDSVAALADVGKATVYAHFKNKDELFRAVVAFEATQHAISFEEKAGQDFELQLRRFAFNAFDLLISPTNIAAFRTVAAEAARSPHLGKLFLDSGPVVIIERLSEFLSDAMKQGDIRPGDSRLAATHFLGLICSDLQVRALLGQGGQISASQRKRVVTEGLRAFLKGYGADD